MHAKPCQTPHAPVQALEVVVAAQEAALLLVPQGDYLGALDVLAELQDALASGLLHGLTAFWQLPAQLAQFREVRAVGVLGHPQFAACVLLCWPACWAQLPLVKTGSEEGVVLPYNLGSMGARCLQHCLICCWQGTCALLQARGAALTVCFLMLCSAA